MDQFKDYLDYAVLGVLGFMSFLMLWFAIERYLCFRRVDLQRFEDADELEIDLTRHLTAIATIGSNAPYVGLLGTVLGIHPPSSIEEPTWPVISSRNPDSALPGSRLHSAPLRYMPTTMTKARQSKICFGPSWCSHRGR